MGFDQCIFSLTTITLIYIIVGGSTPVYFEAPPLFYHPFKTHFALKLKMMPLENELGIAALQSSLVDAVPIVKHWRKAPPGEHAATRHTSHRCTINRWRPFGRVLTPEMLTVELWGIVFSSTRGFRPSVESGESRLSADRWVLPLLPCMVVFDMWWK